MMKVGDWRVTPALNVLERGGRSVKIEPRTMELLVYLARRPGQVISVDELISEVWRGRVFDRGIVHTKVRQLRKALGDDSRDPTFIETIPKRGYRMVARVIETDAAEVVDGAPECEPDSQPRARRRYVYRVGGATLGLATLLLIAALSYYNPGVPVPIESESQPIEVHELDRRIPNSVAVLPCENLSPNPADAFIASGIYVEIVDRLTNLSGLNVFSPDSVRRFGGSAGSISDVSRELRVGSVVTCSVLYTGSGVRIVAQLIDAGTGEVVWSNRYEDASDDLFAMQAELAIDIARALEVQLSAADRAAVAKAPTRSPQAHASYLQALASGFPAAVKHLDAAVAADPSFAAAYGRKAVIHALNLVNNSVAVPIGQRSEFKAIALENANTALQLDPEQEYASNALTLVNLYSWKWAEARRRYEMLHRLKPGDPIAGVGYSWFASFNGDHLKAEQLSRQRLVRDRGPNAYYSLGRVLVWARDGEGAAQAFSEAIRIAAGGAGAPQVFILLGYAEIQRGRRVEAETAFRTAEELLQSAPPGQLGLRAPELIWGYGSIGRRDDAMRLFAFFEQWSTEFEAGAGDWALAQIGIGDYDAARVWLERAVARVQAGEPELGFYNLMTIKLNPFGDAKLEESPFREPRARLGVLN